MPLSRFASRHPAAAACTCALAQFLLTLCILLAGRALLPPAMFGTVKLAAFASTIVLPLLLVAAFDAWKDAGFVSERASARHRLPASFAIVAACLVLVAMNLSMGVHVREPGGLAGDVTIQLLNAFGEELLFRGLLFAILLRLPVGTAIVLNGVLFGSMHLLHGFMDAPWSAAAMQAALTAAAGMMFAAVRFRTATIWPLVALHMAKNLSAMYSNVPAAGGANAVSLVQGLTVALELLIVAYVVWQERGDAVPVPARP